MMIHPVRRQMAWTLLWAGVLVLQFVFSVAADVEDVHRSPVLHRQKRDWIFNTYLASEELPRRLLPQKIGQLLNTKQKPNAKFKISGEGANSLFTVNDAGEILVNAPLDREKTSSYTLNAEIWDSSNENRLDKIAIFHIKVQDINDNRPVFSETPAGFVNERAAKGTFVLSVNATDADDPTSVNGNVIYELLNGTNYFKIANDTGVITVKDSRLDRETQSQYKLIVQASDMPGLLGGLTATTIVTININDINDNMASFTGGTFRFEVPEDAKTPTEIGKLTVKDWDEKQNKEPKFTLKKHNDLFFVNLDTNKDGALMLSKGLDYETNAAYSFTVMVSEDNVVQPPDARGSVFTSAQVIISVVDVNEPPVFTQTEYNFKVLEGPYKTKVIGFISARDPDKAKSEISYSIRSPNCPLEINQKTGELLLKEELDRESEELHMCEVTAQEDPPSNLRSYAMVRLEVLDINDNDPVLVNGSNVYICENDKKGTVIGTIGASDKDKNSGIFRFSLATKTSNFSLYDNLDNTANILLTQGGFKTDHSGETSLDIDISDGGMPPRKSRSTLHIRVCTCWENRRQDYCRSYAQTGVSVSALIAILLCIVTILVIVILFVLRKRYQKETLVALGKSAGEIHEQLVTYDEEGGGEMDTNGYDVSILSSACHSGTLRPTPGPAVYAVAKKPPACKGDMAMMIEVKKDEADHDRDGIPYDTLHIYGYEGTESLAGSLSSLDSSSVGSHLDYDFLSDWGPRFRTLAQLYGMDGSDSDSSY
ncbi:cadherin-5 [Salminus brasiliensis]|uniref:cadherin-5 n=1 Tax=Salminus brasiliensis TaxID=930266 RepID=UPI003B835E99